MCLLHVVVRPARDPTKDPGRVLEHILVHTRDPGYPPPSPHALGVMPIAYARQGRYRGVRAQYLFVFLFFSFRTMRYDLNTRGQCAYACIRTSPGQGFDTLKAWADLHHPMVRNGHPIFGAAPYGNHLIV